MGGAQPFFSSSSPVPGGGGEDGGDLFFGTPPSPAPAAAAIFLRRPCSSRGNANFGGGRAASRGAAAGLDFHRPAWSKSPLVSGGRQTEPAEIRQPAAKLLPKLSGSLPEQIQDYFSPEVVLMFFVHNSATVLFQSSGLRTTRPCKSSPESAGTDFPRFRTGCPRFCAGCRS